MISYIIGLGQGHTQLTVTIRLDVNYTEEKSYKSERIWWTLDTKDIKSIMLP